MRDEIGWQKVDPHLCGAVEQGLMPFLGDGAALLPVPHSLVRMARAIGLFGGVLAKLRQYAIRLCFLLQRDGPACLLNEPGNRRADPLRSMRIIPWRGIIGVAWPVI
jgi:hypothetical protein